MMRHHCNSSGLGRSTPTAPTPIAGVLCCSGEVSTDMAIDYGDDVYHADDEEDMTRAATKTSMVVGYRTVLKTSVDSHSLRLCSIIDED